MRQAKRAGRPYSRIQAYLPDYLLDELKDIAKEENTTATSLCRDGITMIVTHFTLKKQNKL